MDTKRSNSRPAAAGTGGAATKARQGPRCPECRHRSGVGFKDLSADELVFMTGFKQEHASASAGEVPIREGEMSRVLGTLYSGLAIAWRSFADGRKQILSVLMPGDLIGLESAYGLPTAHSVEAVTDITWCSFDPEKWPELLAVPKLAWRVSELMLIEQRRSNARLAAAMACTATRNVAHFLLDMHDRLARRRLVRDGGFSLPLTNQQLAGALGITPVHLRRILNRLRADQVASHFRRRVVIHDFDRLRTLAGTTESLDDIRPLL